MRSAVHPVFGEPADVLSLTDSPLPQPGAGQVRIRTILSPIHNHDLWTVRGSYGYKPSLPAIGGTEAVGTVEALGPDVAGVALGQRVAVAGVHGTWAEYFLAPAGGLVPLPDVIADEAAAQLIVGAPLEAEAVVLAAGAWSAGLLRPLGIRVPLTAERGYHLEFDGVSPLTRPVCPVSRGFYFTPMQGRLRAAGTVELGGIGAPPSPHRWTRLEEGVRSVFADLPPVSRRWMGLRPSIPDSLPVIGMARKGLVLAFGHGHLGLTLAPRTADLVLRALGGEAPLAALDPARF